MKEEPLAGNPFLMRRNKYQPPKTGVPKITSGSENSVVEHPQNLVLKLNLHKNLPKLWSLPKNK